MLKYYANNFRLSGRVLKSCQLNEFVGRWFFSSGCRFRKLKKQHIFTHLLTTSWIPKRETFSRVGVWLLVFVFNFNAEEEKKTEVDQRVKLQNGELKVIIYCHYISISIAVSCSREEKNGTFSITIILVGAFFSLSASICTKKLRVRLTALFHASNFYHSVCCCDQKSVFCCCPCSTSLRFEWRLLRN